MTRILIAIALFANSSFAAEKSFEELWGAAGGVWVGMFFSQSNIIVGKKKGPDLAVWACKSTLRGGGGDNQCKNTGTCRSFCINAMIQYNGAMLRCTIFCGENSTFPWF